MPAELNLGTARALSSTLRRAGASLVRAGYGERAVCAWLGTPLVSDARWVGSPPATRSRRGLGGAIALFVAGEVVDRRGLPFLDDEALGALASVGLLDRHGDSLRARVSMVPLCGVLVCADRLDDTDPAAVGSPDLSAWNVAASLGPLAGHAGGEHAPSGGKSLLDVGTGAGALALVAAQGGARVVGTDIDVRALAFATVNALVNGLSAVFLEGDLYAGVTEPFNVVVMNAPLVRAPLAGDEPLYVRSPRGEALACEFLGGARARSASGAEALCHVQLTPAVAEAAAASGFARRIALHFADATDGTPHTLLTLRSGEGGYDARLRTPLSPALRHLHREVLDRLHATRELLAPASGASGALAGAVLRPAPWLALSHTAVHDGAAFKQRELRFGSERLDEDEVALLHACDGRPLLAAAGPRFERALSLILRGLLVV